MRKPDTLMAEIPSSESGLVIYIKGLSVEVNKFVKEGANEEKTILHRRRNYLLKKASKKLSMIQESKNRYATV